MYTFVAVVIIGFEHAVFSVAVVVGVEQVVVLEGDVAPAAILAQVHPISNIIAK